MHELTARNIEAWGRNASLPSTFPLDALSLPSGAEARELSALDYGCGGGRGLRHLMALGYGRITGCDAAQAMLEAVPEPERALTFWSGDPVRPSLRTASYDLILCVGVLSGVVSEDDRRTLVRTLCGSLVPAGRLVLADFGVSDDYRDRYDTATSDEHSFVTAEGIRIHHFTSQELRGLAESAGARTSSARTLPVRSAHGRELPGHVVVARLP